MLSLLLIVEGATLVSTGFIDLFLTESVRAGAAFPVWRQLEFFVHTLGDCAMLALYPPFLAAAVPRRASQLNL